MLSSKWFLAAASGLESSGISTLDARSSPLVGDSESRASTRRPSTAACLPSAFAAVRDIGQVMTWSLSTCASRLFEAAIVPRIRPCCSSSKEQLRAPSKPDKPLKAEPNRKA